mgnify:FL=1
MSRTRKTWFWVLDERSGTIYAPTASMARGELYSDVSSAWGSTFKEFLMIHQPSIRRAPSHDVTLPERHPTALEISKEQLHIVVHAFGGDGPDAGYRDHFYTDADDANLHSLTNKGLFKVGRAFPAGTECGARAYFHLTKAGKQVALGEQRLYPRHMEVKAGICEATP